MGADDVALQALLNFQGVEQDRRIAQYDAVPKMIPSAIVNFIAVQDALQKQREAQVKYGTPQRGTAPAVSVGAPPADPRRRVLGMPLGRAPQVSAVPPIGPAPQDFPQELLTDPAVTELRASGQPIYSRAASPNYRPGTVGTEQLNSRVKLFDEFQFDDPASIITAPELTPETLRGARPKVKADGKALIPVTEAHRQKAIEQYGYDVFGDMQYMPDSTFNQFIKPPESGITPSLSYQMTKDKEKEGRELQELQVPGYKLGGKIRPTQKEAQDVRDGTAQVKDFVGGVDHLIRLIEKNGSSDFIGKESGVMSTLVSDLKLTLKDVKKLGVLSSSDYAMLDELVFDPTSAKSLKTSTPTAIAQLQTVRNRMRLKLAQKLKSLGYTRESAGGPQPGTVVDGYSFKGGDPNDKNNWVKQ